MYLELSLEFYVEGSHQLARMQHISRQSTTVTTSYTGRWPVSLQLQDNWFYYYDPRKSLIDYCADIPLCIYRRLLACSEMIG